MIIHLNGEDRQVNAENLSCLIQELGMKSDRIAVELNREIVPRSRWELTPLREGDKLEIVHFVGGGTSVPLCKP